MLLFQDMGSYHQYLLFPMYGYHIFPLKSIPARPRSFKNCADINASDIALHRQMSWLGRIHKNYTRLNIRGPGGAMRFEFGLVNYMIRLESSFK